MKRAACPRLAAASLGACSTAPGTGWSRANDLSVYGAMQVFRRARRSTRRPIASAAIRIGTLADWERDFAARQDGGGAACWPAATAPTSWTRRAAIYAPRVACGDVHDPQWRRRYTRMLRLLETPVPAAGRGGKLMDFISILSIFVLACFVGYYVVWSVTPALHTPLMAVTNAISSVIIVGALIAAAAHGRAGRRSGSASPRW